MKEPVAFYRCEICGNLVGLIKNGGGQLVCCGQPMTKLTANTVDASIEKHVPVSQDKDGKITVKVGKAEHPMTNEHYIEWIAVTSKTGTQRISLSPGEKPEAVFCSDEDYEVYAYCNIHGLWKESK